MPRPPEPYQPFKSDGSLEAFLNGPRRAMEAEIAERKALLHGMTGWQRAQALKHCKGKIQELSTPVLRHFAKLEHFKKNGHVHVRAAQDVEPIQAAPDTIIITD